MHQAAVLDVSGVSPIGADAGQSGRKSQPAAINGWHPRGWAGEFLAYLNSPWGYDEPEILRYSNRQFGPIGADAGQFNYLDLHYYSHSIVPGGLLVMS
jgi:hypothetical protein